MLRLPELPAGAGKEKKMDVKKLIKDAAKRYGMDLCGISGVDRFVESPKGQHPTELLPGCKSVIVVGRRLLDGIVQANFRCFEDGRRDLKGLWGTYGYAMLPNFELTYACYALAQYIECELGEVGMPLSTGPMTNGIQLSIRHAAVAAGLGEFSWMGLVVSPEFGARNRFGVILTTAEIEPDPMYDGPKLCNPEKCGICSKICPTGALSAYGEDKNPQTCKVGDKCYTYCNIDRNRCQLATLALNKKLGGKADYVTNENPTDEEIWNIQLIMPADQAGLQHVTSHNCGKCQSYCPIGSWNEKFKQRGLTKGAGAAMEVR